MIKLPELLDEKELKLDDAIARRVVAGKINLKTFLPINLLLFLYFALERIDIEDWKINAWFVIATIIGILFYQMITTSKHIYDIIINKKNLKLYSVNALNKRTIIDISLDEIKKVKVKEKRFGVFRNELKIYLPESVKTFLYNGEKITELINDLDLESSDN